MPSFWTHVQNLPAAIRRTALQHLLSLALAALAGCAPAAQLPTAPAPTPTAASTPIPAASRTPTPAPAAFIRGVDASYLQQIEDAGGTYAQDGQVRDALEIFTDHGVNYVRLRLWLAPSAGYNDLAHTLLMARRVKALGLGLLIDFHYSDQWADPGQQTKPAAWASLTGAALRQAVRDYTRQVIAALKEQDTLPDMVQLGNEIRPGLLWDDGRVGGAYDSNWPQLAALLQAGVNGVNAALAEGEQTPIMLHIDTGGDNAASRWFFDHLVAQQAPFDYIGLSYYPCWHGPLTGPENNLNDLAARYHKPLVIVETAYPWSLESNDRVGNLVGPQNKLLPAYPVSVDGQRRFLLAELDILKRVPDGLGKGLFYWAADDISAPRLGSVFENAALFDFHGQALESPQAFRAP